MKKKVKFKANENLQAEFNFLVKNPSNEDAGKRLKFVALELWYNYFIPKIHSFKGEDAAQAGYILDKISRYNCLSSSSKEIIRSQLLSRLKKAKGDFIPDSEHRDLIAKEWCSVNELKKEFRMLLKYQRRSYKDKLPI